jgi:hypothetical protein
MMAARRNTRRNAEQPPENESLSKIIKAVKKKSDTEDWRKKPVREKSDEVATTDAVELPYVEVLPLPQISKISETVESGLIGEKEIFHETGYKNRAPLQLDGRAKDLILEALKMPINLTTEDLLNVSEQARQELKKLLTKKRLEKKAVAFIQEPETVPDEDEPEMQFDVVESSGQINASQLPEATYEILTEEKDGMPKGSLVVSDPVIQYLNTMAPGERPKTVVVASESQGLRAVYPLINNVGEVESLLDGGSQIVSMSKSVAVDLEIPWDPDITVQMQSANRSLEQTLGLAKNVPFLFGHITVYLQIHIMERPAYKVLLGRPFDTITESVVKNARDGGQSLTLTDPNTGERCVMHTHERGKTPIIIKKPVKADFQ